MNENEDLQQRALEIAMQYPEARAGDIESRRDDLWVRLYEELGWKEASLIDLDLLMTQVRRAVEAERLREAGYSAQDIEQWLRTLDFQNLIEQSRPASGKTFDRARWAGPLADLITGYIDCDIVSHPYLRILPPTRPKAIEAMLVELGAPAVCVVGRLGCPRFEMTGKRPRDGLRLKDEFYEGSKLPLKQALEIAEETVSEAEIYCLPRRLAYLQDHEIGTHPGGRAIVYRPT